MKLHPKAKAALRYHNAHSKQRDIEKCDFSKAAHAISVLEEYAPKIAKRISAIYREMQSGWFLYLGAEFLIHLESKRQTIEEAERADAWLNYSYKEYMIQDHHNVKHVDVFHKINDIPF
ncbi:hypothetical protein V6260_00465 [Pseudoalteromonas aliena]|uniref:hypothetical protein n=1 Tax=Pseudoalteromonas aliena TaxID=247523 RepID=UPI0031200BCD